MKKKIKGFSLVETIFALAILALIAITLLPSLKALISDSKEFKEESKIIFALEEAIEEEKAGLINIKDEDLPIDYEKMVNNYPIQVSVSKYKKKLYQIRAAYKTYDIDVIEVLEWKKEDLL